MLEGVSQISENPTLVSEGTSIMNGLLGDGLGDGPSGLYPWLPSLIGICGIECPDDIEYMPEIDLLSARSLIR